MHRHTTHNKCYGSFKDFSIAMLNFLRDDVPGNWRTYCDEVTDNFRVIDPNKPISWQSIVTVEIRSGGARVSSPSQFIRVVRHRGRG